MVPHENIVILQYCLAYTLLDSAEAFEIVKIEKTKNHSRMKLSGKGR